MPVQYAVASASEEGGLFNEDAYVVRTGQPFVAAVADGHMGLGVDARETIEFARYVSERTADVMAANEAAGIPGEFDRIAAAARACGFHPRVGAVVCGIALHEARRELLVAHAGDVRLYANIRWSRHYQLFTSDHVADNRAEAERLRPFLQSGKFRIIEDQRTEMGNWGPNPVVRLRYVRNGIPSSAGLIPTRGFGDDDFQPAYTHVPDVNVIPLAGSLEHAVFALCSDGARRNIGRTFAHFERNGGVPADSLEPLVPVFLDFHAREADDDATVVFFRLVP